MVSRQGPSRVRAAQLQDRCLQLRANGLSFREIARELKVAPATAYKAVARGLAAVNAGCREQAQELRALEALRLDQMQAALWQQAIEERDCKAIDRILRIMERRARLLGPALASDWAEISAAKVSWRGRRARVGVPAGDLRLTQAGCGWPWRRLERRRRR